MDQVVEYESQETEVDVITTQEGGKGKGKKAKAAKAAKKDAKPAKKASKSPAAASPKAKDAPKKKKGGAIVDDLKSLAVPFAILLAKEGVQSLFDSKSEMGVAQSTPKSASPAKKTPKAKGGSKQEQQAGGTCMSCQEAAKMTGGIRPRKGGKATLRDNYATLAEKIDEFLAKY